MIQSEEIIFNIKKSRELLEELGKDINTPNIKPIDESFINSMEVTLYELKQQIILAQAYEKCLKKELK